mgnify:CR=1 FL=1
MADNDEPENRLIAERRAKLAKLRDGGVAFPNDFRRDALAGELHAAYGAHTAESLAAVPAAAALRAVAVPTATITVAVKALPGRSCSSAPSSRASSEARSARRPRESRCLTRSSLMPSPVATSAIERPCT